MDLLANFENISQARIRGLLEQIPIDIFVEGGKGDAECAICMGDFHQGDPIRFLPCMHSYHLQCIDGQFNIMEIFSIKFYITF